LTRRVQPGGGNWKFGCEGLSEEVSGGGSFCETVKDVPSGIQRAEEKDLERLITSVHVCVAMIAGEATITASSGKTRA
jgi:hypothetical protein